MTHGQIRYVVIQDAGGQTAVKGCETTFHKEVAHDECLIRWRAQSLASKQTSVPKKAVNARPPNVWQIQVPLWRRVPQRVTSRPGCGDVTDNDGDTNAARDAPRITPCMMAVQNAVSTHDLYRREEAQEAAVTLPFHLPD